MSNYRYRVQCPTVPGDRTRLRLTWEQDCRGCTKCADDDGHICHLTGLPAACMAPSPDDDGMTYEQAMTILDEIGAPE